MNMSAEDFVRDIAPFADLGNGEITSSRVGSHIFTVIYRNGEKTELSLQESGVVTEVTAGSKKVHASFKALLASENFADLGRWADSQQLLLRSKVQQDTIPVIGTVSESLEQGGVEFFDGHLSSLRSDRPRVLVALIDGPAGIGKTSLLRSLAYRRAEQFRRLQEPLLLHVESRGRMLQNITDLMAFSLQTLRVQVTYDQIPVLVRHGLVSLAIDGFDELGDPNGYDLAWAQVTELAISARGEGTIILAGRETFIGADKILSAIKSIDLRSDKLVTFSLNPISPTVAKNWLSQQGWSQADFDSEVSSVIFEPDSYALRPFFLKELSKEDTIKEISSGKINNLLTFLIESMALREVGKFGSDVDTLTTAENLITFIKLLMEEVARDLAENQSSAISDDNLMWLAEAVAADLFPESILGIVKHRAGVIAFLSEDDRRGYKRFIHEQVYSHFLSSVTVNSVTAGETAKFVRRNIFGFDFLELFSGVVRQRDSADVQRFVESCKIQLDTLSNGDRARSNLAAFVVAALGVAPVEDTIEINNVNLDELWTSEVVSGVSFKDVAVGQLYARGADLSSVVFNSGCYITTLIADDGTAVPVHMPFPALLSLPREVISDPKRIAAWCFDHSDMNERFKGLSFNVEEFGLFPLFNRLSRYKQYWLKAGSDERAVRKILEDENWDVLKKIMVEHQFLVERYDVPASGPKEAFYHVRNRRMLTGLEPPDSNFRELLSAIAAASINLEGGVEEAARKLIS